MTTEEQIAAARQEGYLAGYGEGYAKGASEAHEEGRRVGVSQALARLDGLRKDLEPLAYEDDGKVVALRHPRRQT